MHDAMLQTVVPKKIHQVFTVWAAQYVLRSVGADVSLPHSGKVSIKLAVEVLPVSLAKCHSHAKINDAAHPCLGAIFQDASNILLCIIDER